MSYRCAVCLEWQEESEVNTAGNFTPSALDLYCNPMTRLCYTSVSIAKIPIKDTEYTIPYKFFGNIIPIGWHTLYTIGGYHKLK